MKMRCFLSLSSCNCCEICRHDQKRLPPTQRVHPLSLSSRNRSEDLIATRPHLRVTKTAQIAQPVAPQISFFRSPTGATGESWPSLGSQLSNTWKNSWLILDRLSNTGKQGLEEFCSSLTLPRVRPDSRHVQAMVRAGVAQLSPHRRHACRRQGYIQPNTPTKLPAASTSTVRTFRPARLAPHN